MRWQSTDGRKPIDSVDADREERIQQKELKPTPELVSTTSTISAPGGLSSGSASKSRDEDDTEMLSGIKSDLVRLRQVEEAGLVNVRVG